MVDSRRIYFMTAMKTTNDLLDVGSGRYDCIILYVKPQKWQERTYSEMLILRQLTRN